MRHYALDDEVRLGLGRELHHWRKAGLLTPGQEHVLRPDAATDLRRTGAMLRLALAAFTVLAGAAAIGLVALITGMGSELTVAITAAVLGTAAFGASTTLVRTFRLYRYGVEETLAMAAVALWGVSAALLASQTFATTSSGGAWFFAMAAVAASCAATYRRFGFQYAAVSALYATALLPMASGSLDIGFTRIFAALVCAAAYVYASGARRRADDDISRSDAEVIRAAAAVGAYLALNSVLPFGRSVDGWYKWTGWVVTWLLPFLVGHAAVMDRDPLLLRVAMVAGLASILTNKAHLGWPRQPWDPMLLGVVLVGAALALRRWLSSGTGGERNGFTARPLVRRDGAMTELASLASVAVQPASTRPVPEPTNATFSGGRSGGAGAGAEF